MTSRVAALLHGRRCQGGKSDDIPDRINVRHGGLEIFIYFEPAALVGRYADPFEPQVFRRADPPRRVHQERRTNLLAAFKLENNGIVGGFGNANDFFVEPERYADIAHLVLQRFDNLAVDELKQTRALFHQYNGNSQRGQDASVLAANDPGANDGQRLGQLFQRQKAVAVNDGFAIERNVRRP